MKKVILFFLFSVIFVGLCTSQTIPTTPKVKTISYQSNEQQWEYLVISFGKTEFGTPEKMMAYKMVGIKNGSESIDLQSNLDVLGRFGWELVNIVGVIAGDQEIVLKRKYDKIRSSNEYGLIQSGKELYLKDLQDIIERTLRLDEERKKYEELIKNQPKLINLDDVERANKKIDFIKALDVVYKDAFAKTEIANQSSIKVDYKSAYSDDIYIKIEVDLTEKFLLNNNSYHGDEIKKYLRSFLETFRFCDSSLTKYQAISIIINGTIKFNGESTFIDSETTTQIYRSLNWSNY
ncbi:MAG: hypothetical protein ACOYMD_09185 [Paludibacter sp.]